MDWFRIRHSLRLLMLSTGMKRAEYVRSHGLFHHVGEHCMFMFRKLPLYSDLISVGDNVHLAANVTFFTHDVTHSMLNYRAGTKEFKEYIGCIEIGDNVFIGANTTILYDSKIPSNTIIGANSLVNKVLTREGVYAGIPVRYICSLDEFISKRKGYSIALHKSHHRLTPETVSEAWKVFHEKAEAANQEASG